MIEIIIIAISAFAAVLTMILSIDLKMGPVNGSALPSLFVGSFFYVFSSFISSLLMTIPAAFFGASFVGMCSKKRIATHLQMAIAGAIFGVIFNNFGKIFNGFGGGLGTAACLSVVITIGFYDALNFIKHHMTHLKL